MSNKGRTLADIYNRIVSHPVFPVMFLQEAVKVYVMSGWKLTPKVWQLIYLTIVASALWTLSDMDRNWYETIIGSETIKRIFQHGSKDT